ncbi:PhzF family phenazine biosynthesis protein [Oribacterium sp. WCC10]|uniref:PhzF family phenazine biosynthesis protein n=1 Tax=Oribacterium sp. WCC10 TaxID=1855343 RepID=UPI0008E441C8|nr:PhzF family phenazine biosynthesis protein [Oribacterium sp. WCC10]SFG82394.1 Phenazine biosynthesis-like protein [Oribacterium sp. WCC10]
MLVLDRKEDVINFIPDYSKIMEVTEGMGLFITAPSKDYDFVSRTFFPKIKVNEDPVCESAHCNLIPYWSKRLGKDKMTAFQASPRGGIVYCENKGERVIISGNAALYSESSILDDNTIKSCNILKFLKYKKDQLGKINE